MRRIHRKRCAPLEGEAVPLKRPNLVPKVRSSFFSLEEIFHSTPGLRGHSLTKVHEASRWEREPVAAAEGRRVHVHSSSYSGAGSWHRFELHYHAVPPGRLLV